MLQQVKEGCVNTVSYDANKFAIPDYVDNDCDGRVDEELCIGDYINTGTYITIIYQYRYLYYYTISIQVLILL